MKIKPVANIIVVERYELPKDTGIIIQPNANEESDVCAGITVASARSADIGDIVIYSRYVGLRIDYDGRTQFLIKTEDVLGVMST